MCDLGKMINLNYNKFYVMIIGVVCLNILEILIVSGKNLSKGEN